MYVMAGVPTSDIMNLYLKNFMIYANFATLHIDTTTNRNIFMDGYTIESDGEVRFIEADANRSLVSNDCVIKANSVTVGAT